MAYIGRQNLGGAYRQLDDISSGFDGSDTTHTMQVNSQNVTVGDVNQIILSLGGVIQKPGTDFTVSGSVLTFTTAPAANTSFFAILLGSDNGGTVTPTDGSVTGDKVASTGAFTIGATGTASSLAGIPFYNADNSIYTHDVSGTDSTAEKNVAIGITAMDAITTGDQNVAIGHAAASAITDDAQNVAVGASAMETSVSTQCTAVGFEALKVGQYGGHTAIGFEALKSNTTGANNTAVGSEAMENNTLGNNNVAVGLEALTANTEGNENVAIGSRALDACDTESYNTAVGYGALGGSIAGAEYSVGVGTGALEGLTSGDGNVAMGRIAGGGVTSGAFNTYLGHRAGNYSTVSTTGDANIVVGAYAKLSAADGSEQNVFGYNAIGKGNNTFFAGSTNVYNQSNTTTWQQTSDERVKKNIVDYDKGLNEINKLKVRTFEYRRLNEMPLGKNGSPLEQNEMPKGSMVGLIAQETIDIFPNAIHEQPENGRLSLKPDEINWALIKAVQELSAKIKKLEDK